MAQASDHNGKRSRHTPLDQNTVLKKAYAWVSWIQTGRKVSARDRTRTDEAFRLVSIHDTATSYSDAVQLAHVLGGKELTAILALSVGKSAFRDMKQKLQQDLPEILAKSGWHMSKPIQEYVRTFEMQSTLGEYAVGSRTVHPAYRPADDEDCSNFDEASSVATPTRAPSSMPEASPPPNPTPSQQAAIPLTLQPQYQAGECG
ncbi:MAG: hypothetical protein Q9184_004639 [Pyrenodesmia sp. 2 TL-2023]